jgi:hypothetical protein
MQFKVSQGLKPAGSFSFGNIFSPLQQIRQYRRAHALADNPTLYFKLRDKAKTAEEYQHNVLLKLNSSGFARGFYVAPLSLDKDEHYKILCGPATRTLDDPFILRHLTINDRSWISYIGMIPFLRAHITIPPMERITDAEHHYSYSATGDEIAFHSPSRIFGVSRFSDTLQYIMKNPYWLTVNDCLSALRSEFGWFENETSNNNENPLVRLQTFGRQLYNKIDIRQILLFTSKENQNRWF